MQKVKGLPHFISGDGGLFSHWAYNKRLVFALLLLACQAVLLISLLYGWGYDDPYITFRYARNLVEGRGFVYNTGERVLSTTTPLYALILAALGRLWSDLPVLSNFLGALSLAGGALFLYLTGEHYRQPATGLIALALYPLFPQLASTLGSETPMYVMLILGSLYFYARRQLGWMAILAGLATLTRPDGVLVLLVIGVHYLIFRRQIPWRAGLAFVGVIAPWYGFAWIYFGSPLPVTLIAKRQQAQLVASDTFFQGFVQILQSYRHNPLYWWYAILIGIGIGYGLGRTRQWLPLYLWALFYFAAYVVLDVPRYPWYYAPLVPAVVMSIGLAATALAKLLRQLIHDQLGWAIFALTVASLFGPQLALILDLQRQPDTRLPLYREAGLWISENTPGEASVGALEVGIIGYYAQRQMIDFAGLIQPAIAQQLSSSATYEDAAIWAIQAYEPTFILIPSQFKFVGSDWFEERYGPYRKFYYRTSPLSPLVLYSRIGE